MSRVYATAVLAWVFTACPAPFDPVGEKLQPPPCTSDADCAAEIIGAEWGDRFCALRPSGFGNCQPGTPQPPTDAGHSTIDGGEDDDGGSAPAADSGTVEQDGGLPPGDAGDPVSDGGETVADSGTTPVVDAGEDECAQICLQGQVCRDGDCVTPVCGDGLREGEEECDDNNEAPDDACTDSCTIAECGDRIRRTDLQPGEAGYEECDDGNNNPNDGCDTECARGCFPICGDGEVCIESDDVLVCSPTVCGDGRLDPGEECDDGNNEPTDACVNLPNGNCANARCGDNFIQANVEECDFGDIIDGDGCSRSCQIEADCEPGCLEDQVCREGVCDDIECGNGFREAGEECDDGDDDNSDDCTNDCREAVCGDGHVRADGVEACDDGDDNSNDRPDACREDCTLPRCGDEIIDNGEDCDDGNIIPDDGCSGTCRLEGSTICDLFRDGVFSGCGGCHSGNNPSGGLLMDMTNARSFFESLQLHQNRFQLNLIGLGQGEGNHLNSYLYHKMANTQGTVQINKGLTCSNDFERPCQSDNDCQNDGRCEGRCEDPNQVMGPPPSCTPGGNECEAPTSCMNLFCSVDFALCENDADCGDQGGVCQGICQRDMTCTPGGNECLAVETCGNTLCDNDFSECNDDGDCNGGTCSGNCERDPTCTPGGDQCLDSEICAGSAPIDCGDLCGSRMPMGGPPFSAERLTRVQQWLELPQEQGGPFVCTDRQPCAEDDECAIGEVCDTGLCREE